MTTDDTTEFGEYGTRRSWIIDEHGVKHDTAHDNKSFSDLVEERELLKRLYVEGRFEDMDPRGYYEAQKLNERYVDDRIRWHEKQHHKVNSLKGTPITKTVEQFEDAVEDAKADVKLSKLVVKLGIFASLLGGGVTAFSTVLIVLDVLNGFWRCVLPVVLGVAVLVFGVCLFMSYLTDLQTNKRDVRIAERSKRDFESAEAARQVAEYAERQARGEV